MKSEKYYFLTATLKVLLPLFLLALTLGYIVSVINPVPLADEWRWMEDLLIPYAQGDINFWQYITGEYTFLSHSHYFTLLFIFIDYQWLGLDFSHMAYLGLAAYVLTWCMLVWYYLSLHNYQLDSLGYGCLLLLTLGYASPLSDFPWGLVLFEYLYYFFALGLLCLFDLSLRSKIKFTTFVAAFAFSVIFTETIGLIAVLTILGWSILACATKQFSWKKSGLLWLIFITLLAAQFALLGHGVGGRSSLVSSAAALISNPGSILTSLLITFAQPLADQTLLSESRVFGANFRAWHLGIGVFGLAISLASMGIYIAGGGLKKANCRCCCFCLA